ncbi:OmpA/MotB family protein [Inconstantimicrobium mannanitabidum]|uniref:Chemotaxis protein MotA n=1 Tax=Inconstantimicrobium mannanitabidum TaxID=1604901 RepID=A0ACB5RH58_9CLOT|nr:OmpA family protein [Clostridium sp. TW13]GKX68407.1 chemotaxis protein MotA [Clostridium sp. TW13]
MKKKPKKEPNNERWMLTYLDLITLLMVFFVVLYASSNVNQKKLEEVTKSMQVAFGTDGKNLVSKETTGGTAVISTGKANGTATTSSNATKQAETTKKQSEEEKLDEIQAEVDKLVNNSSLKGSVSTTIQERGLVISFKDNIFFESGKAELKDDMRNKLNSIANILSKINNYIRVEGHTDSLPINTAQFNSNWQLSSVRAANVVQYLVENTKLDAARLSSVGYADQRPVASNSTDAGRSKNRRVDIVILNSKFNNTEDKN